MRISKVFATYRIPVDYDKSIDYLLTQGGYQKSGSWPHPDCILPDQNQGRAVRNVSIILVESERNYDNTFSLDEAEKSFTQANLHVGNLKELLTLGIQYPNALEHSGLVAFGTMGWTGGLYYCPHAHQGNTFSVQARRS